MADDALRVAGVRLTSPDKLLYPDEGITKRQLADYYLRVADRMLPYITGRLLSLVRCPQGSETKCFFQRHASQGFPDEFYRLTVKEADGGGEEYIYIEGREGLVAAAQVGALELHIWGSSVKDVERPDRIVFDLDPDEGLSFTALKAAAGEVRAMLEDAGLKSFVMATGGKGLHIVCPIEPRDEWPEVKAFTRAVAEALAAAHPDRFTTNIRKAARKGRIFIDYLRNDRMATAICPYSTRNRPGGPIAAPLDWDALDTLKSAHPIGLTDTATLDRLLARDPWADYFEVSQALPTATPPDGKKTKGARRKKRTPDTA
jgi:bifunctional non-homologous end joining protein LigD